MSAGEYVYFNADIPTSGPRINEHEVDRRERLREESINVVIIQSNESKETQEISDDDDAEEVDDIQEKVVTFVESFAMFDKRKKCFFLDDESQMMLSTLTSKSEEKERKFDKSIPQLIIHASYILCISLEMKKNKLYVISLFFNPWKA